MGTTLSNIMIDEKKKKWKKLQEKRGKVINV
jgi:hypothetical protein